MNIIIAGTGHRPPRLGLDYTEASHNRLTDFVEHVLSRLNGEYAKVELVVSGMALGFDTALAEAAVRLGIPLVAAIPFDGFGDRWSPRSQQRLNDLVEQAKHAEVISDKPSKSAYIKRDHWMVDYIKDFASDGLEPILLALFDGKSTDSGTWKTMEYAKKKSVTISNIYDEWLKVG